MDEHSRLTEEQKEHTYRSIFKDSCEPKFIIERDGCIVDANSSFCKRIGKEPIECIGMNIYSMFPSDVSERRKKYADKVFLTGKRLYFEEDSDGHYFRNSIYPIFGDTGEAEMLYIFVQDITEIKLSELKHKRHAAFSKEAMEAFPGAFTVLDSRGSIVSCNSYFRNLIASAESDDLSGINTFELFHPDDRAFAYKKLENILTKGTEETADLRIRLYGGSEYRWFRISTKRLVIDNEIFLVSSGTDIEKYKNTEKQLSFTNDQLRFIQSESRIGSWEWYPLTDTTIWSDVIWELYNIKKHSCEPSYKNWVNSIIDNDRKAIEQQVSDAVRNSVPFKIEWRVQYADDTVHWLMARAIPFNDTDGKAYRYAGTVIDITDLKETEQKLRESEERFRNFFEQHSAVMMILDPDTGNIVDINNAATEFYGWSKELLLQKNVMELNIEKPEVSVRRLEDWKTADKRTFIVTHRKADGTLCDIETFGKKIKVNGKWLAFLILHDITEQTKFQQALVESSERMHFILKATNAGIWESDTLMLESRWSDELFQLYGIEMHNQPLTYEKMLSAIIPEDRASFEQAVNDAISNKTEFNANWKIRDKNGSIRWLLGKGNPVRDTDGELSKYVGIVLDITEQKRAEEENKQLESRIRRSERIETLGNLAGGIAHDFNNILTPILSYAEMGMMSLPEDNPLHEYFNEITLAAERAQNLVYQILTFSKARETESSSVTVQSIIDEALKLLRPSIPSTIRIEKSINPSCRDIFADPSKIYQVILNLCTNAYQAMEDTDGTLLIKLDEIEPDSNLIKKFPELHEQPYVKLTISDTGHGMDNKTIERIFEPFFTTKPVNKGTGLGLSVVHGIITGYNGVINVESVPEKGTTFEIYLPASNRKTTCTEQKTVVSNRTARILLVDDEEAVLEVMSMILTQSGHRIQAVNSPRKALELFEQSPDGIDVVVTDLTMPEMTGVRLAAEIYSYRPELPVILMTGYEKDIDNARQKEKNNIIRLLKKPIRFNTIISAINEAIDRKNTTL